MFDIVIIETTSLGDRSYLATDAGWPWWSTRSETSTGSRT